MNWSYIACFIDTDGCIGIYTTHIKYKDRHYNYQKVWIIFFNDCKNALELIKEFIGYKGKINPKRKRENNKIQYVLYLKNQKMCKKVLEKCIPFMVIKKDKAKKCLKFLDSNT